MNPVDLSDNNLSEAEKWNSYYREFADKSDRAAAIVGATMLETSLSQAIQHHSDVSSGSTKRLHDFNSKIDEAYRVELISEIQKQDLHTIRFIRNHFAHELSASSFNEPSISELCQRLILGRRFLSTESPLMRELFSATVAALMYWLSIKLPPSQELVDFGG